MQRSGCFGMRIAILLAVGTIALFIFGVNGIYNGVKYREPVTLTYAQFLQQKPTAGWYHITGALMNVVEEVHIYDKNKHSDGDLAVEGLTRAYIPVCDAKTFDAAAFLEKKNSPSTFLLLHSNDPEIANTIKDMAAQVGGNPTPEQAETYLNKNKNKLFLKKDIDGMVKSGLGSETSEVKRLLDSNIQNLESDYVILDEGAKPSLGAGVGMLLLGLVLAAAQVLFYARQRMSR